MALPTFDPNAVTAPASQCSGTVVYIKAGRDRWSWACNACPAQGWAHAEDRPASERCENMIFQASF